MSEVVFTITKFRRNGNHNVATGTLAELTKYFGYTLKCGNSYNSRISLNPRTVKSLVSHLNRSTGYTQRGSFNPDYYQLTEAA